MFVYRQGGQMEILIKAKQADNPQFGFLNQDNALYKYYRHVLAAIKSGRYKIQSDAGLFHCFFIVFALLYKKNFRGAKRGTNRTRKYRRNLLTSKFIGDKHANGRFCLFFAEHIN